MKSVGERIRQARTAKGMSGEELALRVGYAHQSGIANLEGRPTGRGGNRLAKIADALGVPIAWLLDGPDSDTVPFVRSVPAAALPRAPTPVARSYDPAWPFRTISLSRIEALVARLGSTRGAVALDEMERHLDVLLERWEREAHEANRGAA